MILSFLLLERGGHAAGSSSLEKVWIQIGFAPRRGVHNDVTDHEDGGAALDVANQRRKVIQYADDGLRIRTGRAGEHADRSFRRTPGPQ